MSFDFSELNNELSKIMESRFQTFLDKVRELDDTMDDKFLKLAWKKANGSGVNENCVSQKPSSQGCPYVFTRGNDKGNTCGSKSKIGGVYCSAHKKYEGMPKKETETKTRTRTESVKSDKSNQERRVRPHPELKKLCHSQSGLTFENNKNGVQVDGKIVDDTLCELSPEDLDTVYKWQFPIEPILEKKLKEVEEVVKKPSPKNKKNSKKQVDSDSEIED